jgi:flagella basal body P-ring formation protein FlgA
MIAIPGNAETNPAAVAEMAKNLGSSKAVAAAAPAPTPAPVADIARASGYRAATSAADAAMRHAALALEARAEAADDAMDDAGGLIVVPGPGDAKPVAAASAKAPVAVTRGDASATSAT